MKKRLFIAMHYMELGGAEISLIGLLQALDYSKYDVDLFIYSHQGELMQFIPKEVNLLPEIPAYAYIERPMKDALVHGQVALVAARLFAKLRHRFYRFLHPSIKEDYSGFIFVAECVTPILPSIYYNGEYDLAISFLTPHNIVLKKVKAKKKVCWIHTDYSTVDVVAHNELPIWGSYDHIVSISQDVSKAFLQVFPTLNDKIIEIENILSPQFVQKRATESIIDFNDNKDNNVNIVNILSIGRFTNQKNFDNVPDICQRINSKFKIQNSKFRVCWYIIGFGGDEQLIRQKIVEAGMEENVIILGKKSNPYPYIKACDIYCQPSRYEGKSVTVREAQMLCKPVVVTDYPTAKSQIQDGVDGVIVPLDNEECSNGIIEFIQNENLQKQIRKYLQTHDYGNESEINKIEILYK